MFMPVGIDATVNQLGIIHEFNGAAIGESVKGVPDDFHMGQWHLKGAPVVATPAALAVAADRFQRGLDGAAYRNPVVATLKAFHRPWAHSRRNGINQRASGIDS